MNDTKTIKKNKRNNFVFYGYIVLAILIIGIIVYIILLFTKPELFKNSELINKEKNNNQLKILEPIKICENFNYKDGCFKNELLNNIKFITIDEYKLQCDILCSNKGGFVDNSGNHQQIYECEWNCNKDGIDLNNSSHLIPIIEHVKNQNIVINEKDILLVIQIPYSKSFTKNTIRGTIDWSTIKEANKQIEKIEDPSKNIKNHTKLRQLTLFCYVSKEGNIFFLKNTEDSNYIWLNIIDDQNEMYKYDKRNILSNIIKHYRSYEFILSVNSNILRIESKDGTGSRYFILDTKL